MTDERIKYSKCTSIAKLIQNILEHVIPDYNPIEDEGSIECVLDGVIARSKLALFHVNALITEIAAAERLAKIEELEYLRDKSEYKMNPEMYCFFSKRIAELKEEGE